MRGREGILSLLYMEYGRRFPGLFSGSALKAVALVAMTADHVALHLIGEGAECYDQMRMFGRIAFPVFAFLVAEGVGVTKPGQAFRGAR